MRSAMRIAATLGLTLAIASAAHAAASFGPWSEAVDVESIPGASDQINTPRQDGCPIQSPRRAQPVHGQQPRAVPG